MTATRATPKKPTTARQWKKASAEPVEMPSGNFIRIRRMSMSTLIATGKMPNALLGIVQSAVDKGTGMAGVEGKLTEQLSNEKTMTEWAQFMDDLIVMVAVEPAVAPAPENESDRDEDTLYADEVDEQDKSYIFALVTGGTTDLESFRRATEANVAALSGRKDVELQAVGASAAE